MSSVDGQVPSGVHVLHLNHQSPPRRLPSGATATAKTALLDSVDCIRCLAIVSHQGSGQVALAFSEDGCPLRLHALDQSTTICGARATRQMADACYASFFRVLTRAQVYKAPTCMFQAVIKTQKQPAVLYVGTGIAELS